ncbi:MAG: helix-turn-helix domain-containing protein, partial [Stackebrandtia sp.]
MSEGDGLDREREPNRRLAGARRSRRLTQHQLAEAVREAYWRLFDKEAAIDAEHVSKLERGVITWPNARYRAAFRDVLGAAADAELGFYHHRSGDTVDDGEPGGDGEVPDVRRNKFIRLLTGIGAGAGLGVSGLDVALPDPVREVLALGANPANPPGRVGHIDVEQVRLATATFRTWREQYGGAACRDALAGQVRWAAGLLRGQVETDGIRRDLHSAVGSLADMAGWNDVDAGHHDTASRCFRLALH